MALETVIYPQESLFYGSNKEFYGGCSYGFTAAQAVEEGVDAAFFGTFLEADDINVTPASLDSKSCVKYGDWAAAAAEANSSSDAADDERRPAAALSASSGGRRKRRRTRTYKNKEELESQRMTHIAVERNRRKQMNEYLAVIRSLMPPSYVQRGDQASIIGGAINYVKELEQHLQTLEGRARAGKGEPPRAAPFADFFTFPQYTNAHGRKGGEGAGAGEDEGAAAEKRSELADIEVTMAESHASVKILSEKRPRQLLKIVARLQCLWLTVLHLNVTTVDHMVLYSLTLKVEEGCQLSTVDEIADALHQLLLTIQQEALAPPAAP
ncbi:unnamed protein product [Cuscuta campestris]|uniref:BHLH domain-containing protein n=1 Tax=Cuscuta campestris TaxID=132261 RepID=A0A484LRZ2_9ASTE|nr:unnamed protein product [Cuscuta campestris]